MTKTTVFDVSSYILGKTGQITTMKLQKLVYYCQAWSLVWDDSPLFKEKIEAWANGPVCPELYYKHKGEYFVHQIIGNPDSLSQNQKETIDKVLEALADKPSKWLIDLTHMEDPWLDARKDLAPSERGNEEISHSAMAEYYSSL